VSLYRIQLPGRTAGPYSEEELARMFRSGAIGISTLCCRDGSTVWQEIDEIFPLLKYGIDEELPETTTQRRALRTVAAVAGALLLTAALIVFLSTRFTEKRDAGEINLAVPSAPASVTPAFSTPFATNTFRPVPHPTSVMGRRVSPQPAATPMEIARPELPPAIVQTAELPLAARRRAKEFQVPIYQWTNMANFGGPDVWYKITQDSPSAIFIQWYRNETPRRYEKVTGFEGKNYTSLIGVASGTLYLVDSPRANPGKRIFVVD
jgi:hypothetical protein